MNRRRFLAGAGALAATPFIPQAASLVVEEKAYVPMAEFQAQSRLYRHGDNRILVWLQETDKRIAGLHWVEVDGPA